MCKRAVKEGRTKKLSMVLCEDPLGGALTTSLRDSWEIWGGNNPPFSRCDEIKSPAIG